MGGTGGMMVQGGTTASPSATTSVQAILGKELRTQVGGAMVDVYFPVLLFPDHWASLEPTAAALDNPSAERKAHPSAWVEWRQSSDGYEKKQESGNWSRLGGPSQYAALPRGQHLNRVYFHISGGGDAAFGGKITTIRSDYLRCTVDGRFTFTSSSQNIVVDAGVPIPKTGSNSGIYLIDGYILTLTFDDGAVARSSIVSTSMNQERLYLDGALYCETRRDGKEGCEPL
jgi:hypothetical protein